jgi:hypothetical protein
MNTHDLDESNVATGLCDNDTCIDRSRAFDRVDATFILVFIVAR